MIDLRRLYERASVYYDVLDWPFEQLRYRRLRPQLWAGLEGRLLDLGAGTGRNAPWYPRGSSVVAVDLSAAMLAKARRRTSRADATTHLVQADAARLPLANESIDACVSTFLFCVLPDERQPAALREVRRVLKPGGRLILLEYVYSRNPLRRFGMRAASPLVHFLYGARFDRQTRTHLVDTGFRIEREGFVSGDVLVRFDASKS